MCCSITSNARRSSSPLRAGSSFGAVHDNDPDNTNDDNEADLEAVLRLLSEEGFVLETDGQWHWVHESYPADAISLRSISSDNFVVVESIGPHHGGRRGRFRKRVVRPFNEKAIYIVEGRQHQVEELDYVGRKAYVSQVDCDYYTDAITYTKVTVLEQFDTTGFRNR